MSRRAGIERELASRADQRVLRWFGHVERMDEAPYGQKGVNGRSQSRTSTRETEVRLDQGVKNERRTHERNKCKHTRARDVTRDNLAKNSL